MLRLAKLTDAEYVLGQVAAGLEDYYLGYGESPGVWSGKLAARLGLDGVVAGDDLRALIDRIHPTTGVMLTRGKQTKVRAIDATFSAPKSVSLLWAFGGPDIAATISIAHVEAVQAALEFLEEHAAVTRQQKGRLRIRVRCMGWATATFVHRTSRAGDPQLHSHVVIANLVQRADGTFVALDAAAVYHWAKATGSIYQEELRRRLSDRLGVGWGPDRNGCREMTGISEQQLRVFSKRTIQIEQHLSALGSEPADAKARMQADEAASVLTRPAKDRTLDAEQLRQRWAAEAKAVDLPRGRDLLAAVQAETRPKELEVSDIRQLFARMINPELGLCRHDSTFTEAQVVEAVAAWGAGRLSVSRIETLVRAFLDSDHVVRLVADDPSGRTPGRWSTVPHRRLEDRVLDNLAGLQQRKLNGLGPETVDAAIADGGLGSDQTAAVRVLTGAGAGLRALISPPGYGKTTTLSVAVEAVRRSGRPVLALATTNQAVEQLRQVGIPATTIARFAIDANVLQPGTVLVVDEFSQVPTREADTVLAAVTACENGQLWLVGDPHQAQPVGAGGLAHWLGQQHQERRVLTAELTVNRRQADPVERHALATFRAGHVTQSQELRDDAGWEHHHDNRDQAIEAMATAVVDGIRMLGADGVAALAVTHADCEDLADRVRLQLTDSGAISGPKLEGPGWTGPRAYQAGDRLVLHAHVDLGDGTRITNGTIATVVAVGDHGLAVTTEKTSGPVLIPAVFVTGRGPDGRPQISHAWAQTIDGVQGGTWGQVHLLATPAVDRNRGYVGQSRSIQPTHTWNTVPNVDDGDHGGRLVKVESTTAEQVAAALARTRPKVFAATTDPHRFERQVRAEQASHRRHLDQRPPDVADRISKAEAEVATRAERWADAKSRVQHWETVRDTTSGMRGLTANRRSQHRDAKASVSSSEALAGMFEQDLARAQSALESLQRQQADRVAFDRDNQWRHNRIAHLEQTLNRHWTTAVLGAARDGHPHAYGAGRLQAARADLTDQVENLGQRESGHQAVSDPFRALADLHRAVREHPPTPPPKRANPTPRRRPIQSDMDRRHQMYQHFPRAQSAGPAPPPPSISL